MADGKTRRWKGSLNGATSSSTMPADFCASNVTTPSSETTLPYRAAARVVYVAKRATAIFLLALGTSSAVADPPTHAEDYCSLLATYACHAKSLWHDAPEGGYWGDGINAKNANGAVRGTCNTMLTYAILVRALDEDWVRPMDVRLLEKAGLTRHKLISYIRKNAAYLAAHHESSPAKTAPVWGYHWQSSLWMQSFGMATLLTWNDLGDDLKREIARVAAAEADWVASRPPRDYVKGNTAAEENGWDTGAPAVALAISPRATSATLWWNTLKSYAANTYSHPSDAMSSASLGADKVGEIVKTANVAADWSLDNHGFFHPDYLQVTGQHLGEAWLILKLGDALRGTAVADDFEPYSLHNVQPIWDLVMRPLLLPTGEFAYPAGNDWTYHCTTNQGYFAFINTALDSYDAAEAEARGLQHVKNRREASPPGHLLGDSNLEWWWEPLVCKRMSVALLHHMVRPGVLQAPADITETIDGLTTTVALGEAKAWWHRNPRYFFSVNYGKPQIAYYVPLRDDAESELYTTLPHKHTILPAGPWDFTVDTEPGSELQLVTLRRGGKVIAGVACLPNSVVCLSLAGFSPMQVENDSLTEPGRTIISASGKQLIPKLQKGPVQSISSPWINIDNAWGLVSGGGFTYEPASDWGQRSVAWDEVKPKADKGAWQMLSGTSEETAAVAGDFTVDTARSRIEASIKDGSKGLTYQAVLSEEGLVCKPKPEPENPQDSRQ